ncbi:hypothetical protein N7541_007472 [Penicillium brevicompactum]|uniref:Uncharacterized protein n=1 Tax=Penicillium brevicompactum TaxID=5074 RepID=A0A9W9QXE7_PENBR|nr:hypothetical protein N7541_007472 [Penicillium brevicompactum]
MVNISNLKAFRVVTLVVDAIGPGTYFGLSGLSGLLEYTALQEAQDMLVQSVGSVLHSIYMDFDSSATHLNVKKVLSTE